MSDTLPQPIERALDAEAPIAPVDAGEPMYRIDPSSKVPVSKQHGKLWKGRIAAARSARKVHEEAWDESIRYYNNNQLEHREGRDSMSGNRYYSKRRNNKWSETENIVYANVRAMMPALYAKNPQAEFTTPNEDMKDFVQQVEDVVNTLAGRKHAPGLNLKIHAKQAVLAAELCNLGWMEYGYTLRQQSILAAQDDIQRLSTELADAKDTKTIREVEGQLLALEEELDVLTPPGPFVKYRTPQDVLVDADASMPDYSDAKWMAIREIYPTAYLNARYGKKGEDGQVMSLYEPTHVLLGDASGDDDIKNFKLFETDASAHQYGYESKAQLEKAQRTMCWRIWDRITRRVYLYTDNRWDWPVWAENDPYMLPGFFPLTSLVFNTTVVGALAHSNVTYYLDQQDAINEIHDEFRRARQDVKENILYNNKFNRDSVIAWLTGGGPNAVGVEVPEGTNMRDMIVEKPNSMLKAMQLFDLQRPFQSIDRVSGVSDVMRNVQFKTNTTNKAIENYNSGTALRLDEKIDAIEDALGIVLYNIGYLCAQFMEADAVRALIGAKRSMNWQPRVPEELRDMFQCQTVGGSTQKPTSAGKKQQALEMSEILGKLAQFAPSVVIETILTILEEAFDELNLPADAFERMKEEVVVAMQRGNSTQGAGGGEGATAPTSPTGAAPPPQGGGGMALEELAAMIDALPPQAKVALGEILAKGVPVAEALPEVLSMVQQGNTTANGMM
jgi:hypothetical protein